MENKAGKRALIVDDERTIRYILSRFFESLEYDHESASSAEEALVLLQEKHYDVIVSDCDLPGMSGRELASIARAWSPGTMLVLMSGLSQDHMKESAASAWLQKPFTLEDLTSALKRCGRAGRSPHAEEDGQSTD